jgi:hypothetical protein
LILTYQNNKKILKNINLNSFKKIKKFKKHNLTLKKQKILLIIKVTLVHNCGTPPSLKQICKLPPVGQPSPCPHLMKEQRNKA